VFSPITVGVITILTNYGLLPLRHLMTHIAMYTYTDTAIYTYDYTAHNYCDTHLFKGGLT